MPSTKEPLIRYRKIHERIKLRGKVGATLEELLDLCEVSRSQFMKDKAYMIDTLDAPIEYSRKNKSFYYSEDYELSKEIMLSRQEFNKMRLAFKTLSQLKHLDAYKDIEGILYKIEQAFSFRTGYNKSSFIHLEKVPYYKGTEHIDFFLEAIEFTKEVSFDYYSFKSQNAQNHIFQPYVIKEHTNRWYVVGFNPSYGGLTTFALDRLKGNLRFTNSYYNIPSNFSIDEYLSNVVGLTVLSGKSVERVILHFTALQSQYFLSKPFHSFKSIKEDNSGLIVEMILIPNYELIQKLASFGKGVTILEPQSLVLEFSNFLKATLNNYT